MNSPSLIDRLRKLRRGDPNVVGQACTLTMFTAVFPGREDQLESHLQGTPMASASPWAALRGLHFLRLHIVREFVHQGPSQGRDPLRNAYLVTDASFDGSFPAFIRDMCLNAASETDAVYGHCVGYPGSRDPAALQRWAEINRIENGTVLVAYPDSTVADVRAGLVAREEVADFAARSHSWDAETLQREFRAAFPASVWGNERQS